VGDVIMKAQTKKYTVPLVIALAGMHMQLSHAIPLDTNNIVFQGAIFTLEGEWKDDSYIMTYRADFAGFQADSEPSYLKAIDWRWNGAAVSSVSLLDAPDGTDQWQAQTFHEIGLGYSVGCEPGGGSNSVCTEFLGEPKGFATSTSLEDLRWVFEIRFKDMTQRERFTGGDSFRAAFVNGGGTLVAPIMSCIPGESFGCLDQINQIAPLSEGDANVPVPGVPALLMAGLVGLFLSYKRRTS
jgi:hypothetical protein